MIWTLQKSNNIALQWFFCSLPSELVCIISGGYTRCEFFFFATINCLPSKKIACVDDTFLVPNQSARQSQKRQREIMVWSSARRDIYLQIDKNIYFYHFSFNFSCFGSYFLFWIVFCKSLFGRFRFLASTSFAKEIFRRYNDAMKACKITCFSFKYLSLWFLALY